MTGHDYHSKASAGSVNSRKLTAGTWKRPLGKGNTSIYKPPIFSFHVSFWGLVKTPRVILWSACFQVHFFDLQISKSVAKSALDRSFGASEFLKLTVTYWKRKSGLQWMHTTVPRSTFQGAKGSYEIRWNMVFTQKSYVSMYYLKRSFMSLQTGTCQLLSLHPDSLISAKAMLTGFCCRKKKSCCNCPLC